MGNEGNYKGETEGGGRGKELRQEGKSRKIGGKEGKKRG